MPSSDSEEQPIARLSAEVEPRAKIPIAVEHATAVSYSAIAADIARTTIDAVGSRSMPTLAVS